VQISNKVSMNSGDQDAFLSAAETHSPPVAFERQQIDLLLKGLMPAGTALDFLRQTAEKNLDAAVLKLFVDGVRATVIPEADKHLAGIRSAMDCCGTGGSGLPHYNTSTTVAFVLAAAGVPIAKFGNRAANSLSGSFDLLARIGLGSHTPVEALPELFAETNLVFIFAQQFYPALATIAPLRQAVGLRTVFNLIGPLLNPVKPVFRVLGTPNPRAQELIAEYLASEDHLVRATVVRSQNGLDELEIAATNLLAVIENKTVKLEELTFGEENWDRPSWAISGDECASIFQQLINSELDEGSYFFRTVCLNAAAGLKVAGKCGDIKSGYEMATQLMKDGLVAQKYEQYKKLYVEHSK
jgi:anthranilate phosphoribosyltransferase